MSEEEKNNGTKYKFVFECEICGRKVEPKWRKEKAYCEFHTLKTPMKKIRNKREIDNEKV